ncbi:MAG: hypothetical protein EOM65_15655 [Synergistales bacterium]|nr:hypothetical protein [Synergistales bacterium]
MGESPFRGEYLQRRNIPIPEEVAILSIGGQIGCNFLNPSLSAIDFGSLEIGRSAVQVMLEMIHGRGTWKEMPFQVTPHHITERESTKKVISFYEKKSCLS